MKILRLVIIGIVAVGAIAFWIFYEPSLLISDKEKFSKPILEQVVNHTQLAKLFDLNNINSSNNVDLYDWSNDGKFIIAGFHIGKKNYLVSIDPSGTILEKLDTQNLYSFFPARISPSDRYVLFTGVTVNAETDYTENLYLYDMAAKTMKQLTNNTEYDSGSKSTTIQDYGWTPDGNIIYDEEDAFPVPNPNGSLSFSLWKADMTGKKIDLLCYSIYYYGNPNFKSTPNSCDFADMDISPDGNEIVYSINPQIGIFHLDTNQTTQVQNSSDKYDATPRWIPHSTSIVYTYPPGGQCTWRVGIMSIDGSFDLPQIYPTGCNEGLPVVSSDGNYIMFANSDNDLMRVSFGK